MPEVEQPKSGMDEHHDETPKPTAQQPASVDQGQNSTGGQKKADSKRRRCRAWLWRHGREADVVSNAIIAAFAIVVGVTTMVQGCWMYRTLLETQVSNRIAMQAMEADSRAWIVPRTPDVFEIKCGPAVCSGGGVILFNNVGKSPAFNMNLATRWAWAPKNLPNEPDKDSTAFAAAGKENAPAVPLVVGPIERGDGEAVLAGERRVYVGGVIRYDDVLGQGRETRWCAFWHPIGKDFVFCSEGNVLK